MEIINNIANRLTRIYEGWRDPIGSMERSINKVVSEGNNRLAEHVIQSSPKLQDMQITQLKDLCGVTDNISLEAKDALVEDIGAQKFAAMCNSVSEHQR